VNGRKFKELSDTDYNLQHRNRRSPIVPSPPVRGMQIPGRLTTLTPPAVDHDPHIIGAFKDLLDKGRELGMLPPQDDRRVAAPTSEGGERARCGLGKPVGVGSVAIRREHDAKFSRLDGWLASAVIFKNAMTAVAHSMPPLPPVASEAVRRRVAVRWMSSGAGGAPKAISAVRSGRPAMRRPEGRRQTGSQ
jgi:hypothetical protein